MSQSIWSRSNIPPSRFSRIRSTISYGSGLTGPIFRVDRLARMRISRFAAGGDPQYGIVELAEDNGKHPQTVSVLTGDPIAMPVQLTGERFELDAVRLLAPVIPRSKIVAVGRNYAAHAAELGNDVPQNPLTFFKPNTSVIGPDEPIFYPSAS